MRGSGAPTPRVREKLWGFRQAREGRVQESQAPFKLPTLTRLSRCIISEGTESISTALFQTVHGVSLLTP